MPDDKDIERVSALATALFCAESTEPVVIEGPSPLCQGGYAASCRTITEYGASSSAALIGLEERLLSMACRTMDRLSPAIAASAAARDRREGVPPRPTGVSGSVWNGFHALWTRTNGPLYEKAAWVALERRLIAATCEATVEEVMREAVALNIKQSNRSR